MSFACGFCPSLALAPQPPRALAAEIIACAGLMSAVTAIVQLRRGPDSPHRPRWWFGSRIATAQVPMLLFLAGGITLAAGHGGGLYWVLPATLHRVSRRRLQRVGPARRDHP